MPERFRLLAAVFIMIGLAGCGSKRPSPQTVTMLIESSPTSLDPRIGVDGQSEHIYSLIFDSLVRKDAHFELKPWLATSWETPDPLTYRFHLRTDVHFHNGQALTSADVKYTLDSMRNGTVITAKAQALGEHRSRRGAGPRNYHHSYEATGRSAVVEPLRRSYWDCPGGERPGFWASSRRQRTFPIC